MKSIGVPSINVHRNRFSLGRSLSLFLLLLAPGILPATPAERVLVEFDGIAYFLRQTPGRLQRYNLQSQSWLSNVSLSGNPTALAADADGFYVAYGRTVYRYNLSFGGEVFLRNIDHDVHELFTDGNILIIDHSTGGYGYYTTINKTTGSLIDNKSFYIENTHGTVISRTNNRLYGVREGYSPRDLSMMTYNDDGTIVGITDGPYHGDYPVGTRMWIFPNESRVVDSSGTMYSAFDLTYAGSLGGAIDSLSFNGDLPVILRGNLLQAYNAALLPASELQLDAPANEILVNGEHVILFTHPEYENEEVTAEVVPLADLNAPDPNEPLDPAGLPYEPDAIFPTADEVLLVDFESGMVFTWSVASHDYTSVFALRGNPVKAAYSEELGRLYLAYGDNLITKLEPGQADPVEEPFALAPTTVRGMAMAGTFLMVQDASGAWATHRLYSPDGEETDSADWNYYSRVYEWDPVLGRLYFFRDDTSPNDLHWESYSSEGLITGEGETPYHGSVECRPPIFVFDNGTTILLGSGQMFESNGMTQTGTLPNLVFSAAWMDDTLYTIFQETGSSSWDIVEMDYSLLQKWTTNFGPGGATSVPGAPVKLLEVAGRLLLISLVDGVPEFSLFKPSLDLEWTSIGTDSEVVSQDIQIDSAVLAWNGALLEGKWVSIERYRFNTGEWEQIGTVEGGRGEYTLEGLTAATDYMYRAVIEGYQERREISVPVTLTNNSYLRSEIYLYDILDELIFQKQEADSSWTDVEASTVNSNQVLMEYNLPPFSPINYRALQEMEIRQPVDTLTISSYQLDIAWQGIEGDPYPILVYRYTGNPNTPYELYDTLPAEQKTYTLTGDSPDVFPELSFYADRPYPASDVALLATFTFTTNFMWDPVQGVVEYVVTVAPGNEYRTTESNESVDYSSMPYPGNRLPVHFLQPEVTAVTGTEWQALASSNYVTTTLSYSPDTYTTRYLEYRLSDGEPWLEATTTSSSSVSHELMTDVVPQYRITEEIDVPASQLGICVFDTRVPDNVDGFEGSVPLDTHGNRYVDWLGSYRYSTGTPDVYFSEDLGVIMPTAAGSSGWWIWTPQTGWTLWLTDYPGVMYSIERGHWFKHSQGSSWFYNYNEKAFEDLLP